ncbi:mucin-2-like isoform X2 [Macrosteles quadrilineatus]|uniref:mucin-2-like isoform X2 n=1 Tax=Macrosteles quadrilineatus TaxID=74068 RepID=UPI0023E2E8E3|nr:mucin-2-like isoform X2 [Macrosteles quadrilineatus]
MANEPEEDQSRKRKKWLEDLSVLSSDDEDNLSTISTNGGLNPNTFDKDKVYLRFPYYLGSDSSEDEIEIKCFPKVPKVKREEKSILSSDESRDDRNSKNHSYKHTKRKQKSDINSVKNTRSKDSATKKKPHKESRVSKDEVTNRKQLKKALNSLINCSGIVDKVRPSVDKGDCLLEEQLFENDQLNPSNSRFLDSSSENSDKDVFVIKTKPTRYRRVHILSTSSSSEEESTKSSLPLSNLEKPKDTQSKDTKRRKNHRSVHLMSSSDDEESENACLLENSKQSEELAGSTQENVSPEPDKCASQTNSRFLDPIKPLSNANAWTSIADIKSQNNKQSKVQELKRKFVPSNASSVAIYKQIQQRQSNKSKANPPRRNSKHQPNKTHFGVGNENKTTCDVQVNDGLSTSTSQIHSKFESISCDAKETISSESSVNQETRKDSLMDNRENSAEIPNITTSTSVSSTNPSVFGKKIRQAHHREINKLDDNNRLYQNSRHKPPHSKSNKKKLSTDNKSLEEQQSTSSSSTTCDVLGNIMSQMDSNPFKVQSVPVKKTGPSQDKLGWFPPGTYPPALCGQPQNAVGVPQIRMYGTIKSNSGSIMPEVSNPNSTLRNIPNPSYNPLCFAMGINITNQPVVRTETTGSRLERSNQNLPQANELTTEASNPNRTLRNIPNPSYNPLCFATGINITNQPVVRTETSRLERSNQNLPQANELTTEASNPNRTLRNIPNPSYNSLCFATGINITNQPAVRTETSRLERSNQNLSQVPKPQGEKINENSCGSSSVSCGGQKLVSFYSAPQEDYMGKLIISQDEVVNNLKNSSTPSEKSEANRHLKSNHTTLLQNNKSDNLSLKHYNKNSIIQDSGLTAERQTIASCKNPQIVNENNTLQNINQKDNWSIRPQTPFTSRGNGEICKTSQENNNPKGIRIRLCGEEFRLSAKQPSNANKICNVSKKDVPGTNDCDRQGDNVENNAKSPKKTSPVSPTTSSSSSSSSDDSSSDSSDESTKSSSTADSDSSVRTVKNLSIAHVDSIKEPKRLLTTGVLCTKVTSKEQPYEKENQLVHPEVPSSLTNMPTLEKNMDSKTFLKTPENVVYTDVIVLSDSSDSESGQLHDKETNTRDLDADNHIEIPCSDTGTTPSKPGPPASNSVGKIRVRNLLELGVIPNPEIENALKPTSMDPVIVAQNKESEILQTETSYSNNTNQQAIHPGREDYVCSLPTKPAELNSNSNLNASPDPMPTIVEVLSLAQNDGTANPSFGENIHTNNSQSTSKDLNSSNDKPVNDTPNSNRVTTENLSQVQSKPDKQKGKAKKLLGCQLPAKASFRIKNSNSSCKKSAKNKNTPTSNRPTIENSPQSESKKSENKKDKKFSGDINQQAQPRQANPLRPFGPNQKTPKTPHSVNKNNSNKSKPTVGLLVPVIPIALIKPVNAVMPTVSGMNLENSKRTVCNTESRNFIRIQVPRSHNLPSEVGTSRVESSEASSQTPATVVTMPDSSENVQKLFFTLCDKLFTDVVNFKIPKMAYDLYLLISYDVMKEERFKKINQLLSSETVVSEKLRAEKEFADMIKIRAQSFVPLFMTIVNRIDSDNLKALLTAVYCRIVQKLETIDPITSAYRFKIRSIIKTMLEKHGCKQPEILAYFDSENDTNFLTNFCFIENLLKKYDTEPREVCTNLRMQPNTEMTASSTSTERVS